MKLREKYPDLDDLLARTISLEQNLRSGTVTNPDGSWSTGSAGELGDQEMELASLRDQLQEMVDRIPEEELFDDLHLREKEELLEQLAIGKKLVVVWGKDQETAVVLGGKKIGIKKVLNESGDQFQKFYKVLGNDDCIYALQFFPQRDEWTLLGLSLRELEVQREKDRKGE